MWGNRRRTPIPSGSARLPGRVILLQKIGIADYSGCGNAYLYSSTGTLLETVSLTNATGYRDGPLCFNNGSGGQRIANRYDGCCTDSTYDDPYNLSGTPFTTANTNSTGIAHDGTSFWVSNISRAR